MNIWCFLSVSTFLMCCREQKCALVSSGFTWYFEGNHVLQQPAVLSLFGQAVRAQRELVLLQPGDAECGGQPVGAVAHGFCRGELGHGGKLQPGESQGLGGWVAAEEVKLRPAFTSGDRWARRMLPIRLSRCPRVLALLRDSMVFLILRLWRMGTSDMNSTPPATTASHWPAAISPTAAEERNGFITESQRQQLSSRPAAHLKSWPGWRRCRPWWRCELGSCPKSPPPETPAGNSKHGQCGKR